MADLTIRTLEAKACEYAAQLVETFELDSLVSRKTTKITDMEANLFEGAPDYTQRKSKIDRQCAKLVLLKEAEDISKAKCRSARLIFRRATENVKLKPKICRVVSALAIGTVCSTTKDVQLKDKFFFISKSVAVDSLALIQRILDTLKVKYEAPSVGDEPHVHYSDSESESESDYEIDPDSDPNPTPY